MRNALPCLIAAALSVASACTPARSGAARDERASRSTSAGRSRGDVPAGWSLARRDTLPPDVPPPILVPTRLALAAHAATNAARGGEGLGPLGWSDSLAAVARVHSEDMARRDYFDHTSPDGRRVGDRAAAQGLSCRFEDGRVVYTGFGENLFSTPRYHYAYSIVENGRTSTRYRWKAPDALPSDAVAGWMRSPGHRANLLSPIYRREGLGVAVSAAGVVYFTQVFC